MVEALAVYVCAGEQKATRSTQWSPQVENEMWKVVHDATLMSSDATLMSSDATLMSFDVTLRLDLSVKWLRLSAVPPHPHPPLTTSFLD